MENLCTKSCVCCEESVEEFNARSEATLKSRALTLANVLCVMIFGAHIYFAVIGKELVLPDAFYVVMLSPYCGAAAEKIIAKFTNGKNK